MGLTLGLISLLVLSIGTGLLAIVARSTDNDMMMRVMGITAMVSLLLFGILAMVNGQRQKAARHKQVVSAIQKLPRR